MVFNSRIMVIIHSPPARVGIFILLNNSHHYALVEGCTIEINLKNTPEIYHNMCDIKH
jgi:hypothetical protein